MAQREKLFITCLIIIFLSFAAFITFLIIKQAKNEKLAQQNNQLFYSKTMSHLVILSPEGRKNFYDQFYTLSSPVKGVKGFKADDFQLETIEKRELSWHDEIWNSCNSSPQRAQRTRRKG